MASNLYDWYSWFSWCMPLSLICTSQPKQQMMQLQLHLQRRQLSILIICRQPVKPNSKSCKWSSWKHYHLNRKKWLSVIGTTLEYEPVEANAFKSLTCHPRYWSDDMHLYGLKEDPTFSAIQQQHQFLFQAVSPRSMHKLNHCIIQKLKIKGLVNGALSWNRKGWIIIYYKPGSFISKLHEPNTEHRNRVVQAPPYRFLSPICYQNNISGLRRRPPNYSINSSTVHHWVSILKELGLPLL